MSEEQAKRPETIVAQQTTDTPHLVTSDEEVRKDLPEIVPQAHQDHEAHEDHEQHELPPPLPVEPVGLVTRKKKKKSFNWIYAVTGAVILAASGLALSKMVVPPPIDVAPKIENTQAPPIDMQTDTSSYNSNVDFWAWLRAMGLEVGAGRLNWDAAGGAVDGIIGGVALLGIGGFWYARATRRRYIQIDNLAMIVSETREPTLGRTRIIPWKCMQQVDVHYPKGMQTETMDKDQMKLEDTALAASKGSPLSQKAVLHISVDDGSIAKVKWKDVVSTIEPGKFINAMKTWAPDACTDTVFPDAHLAPSQIDTGAYTQLWFKYYSAGSERKRTTQLVPGDILQEGRFEIAGQIGGGGQGTAYLAIDNQATEAKHNEIVLKEYILPVHRGQQVLQATISKLEQEAAILRKINHTRIVHLLGSFVEDHRGYLVMEFVSGRSLKDIVILEGPQPENVVLELALQICDVLQYLHGLAPPVVHRDLTPDNLILQNDGVVKLVDFNVAHQLESAATATVVGKHCYIPPEQFRGRPTAQSDIYALGCSLHYLLTGLEPEPLTPSKPRLLRDTVSEELNHIIATCTTLDASKRYRTAADVRADILQICPEELRKSVEAQSPFENDKVEAPSS